MSVEKKDKRDMTYVKKTLTLALSLGLLVPLLVMAWGDLARLSREREQAVTIVRLQDAGKCSELVSVQKICRRGDLVDGRIPAGVKPGQPPVFICDFKLADGRWITGLPERSGDVKVGETSEVCEGEGGGDAGLIVVTPKIKKIVSAIRADSPRSRTGTGEKTPATGK